LRLQFTEGKLGESQFGGAQFMFSTDQGPFWVSEAVGNILHDQIRKQKIQPGEPVDICKREVSQGNGRKSIRWEISRVGLLPGEQPDGTFAIPNPHPGQLVVGRVVPANGRPGADALTSAPVPVASQPPVALVSNGNGSKQNGHANGSGKSAAPAADGEPALVSWASLLLQQTEQLIEVFGRACEYASQEWGNQVRGEDVRALLLSAFINVSKNGGANVA